MKAKYILFHTALASVSAMAGTEKAVIQPAAAPAPTLGNWFLGGTYGQLNGVDTDDYDRVKGPETTGDLDADMVTLQAGRDFDTKFLGCDLAAYLEVGLIDGSADYTSGRFGTGYGEGTGYIPMFAADVDVEVIPFTANVKLERTLVGGLGGYVTAGVGFAMASVELAGAEIADETGFYAQASAGLLYNITPSFEVFGGARWVHLDSLDVGLNDGFAWELGLRYNF